LDYTLFAHPRIKTADSALMVILSSVTRGAFSNF